MEKERVTISDIAEELGLSTATVSNVIHGKTKKMSAETVKRVQELLERRAYIPSMAALLLAQNSSKIIGVVVNDHEKYEGRALEDGYVSSAVNSLSREIDRAGFFMMVKATSHWDEIVRFASMWNMEGLVIMGFCESDYQKLRASMHIPFVVYDGYFQETQGICNLIIDNYDGGLQAGRYLRSLGHRRVLCISDNYICVDSERMDGCSDGMGAGTVDFMQIPFQREARADVYRRRMAEILEYSAVFAVSDFYAVELMAFLMEQGVRIPEELSVVGFDDSPLCRCCFPSLTTVRQDVDARAAYAVEMLQNLKAKTEARTVLKLPVTLIERGSVCAPGSRNQRTGKGW